MFGRKKNARRKVSMLILLDAAGSEISACPVSEYELPEEVVLALSTEYFNDPEPCEIHRGAVHRRAMMELMDKCPAGKTVSLRELPEPMRVYFPARTDSVRIAEEMR